MDIVNMNDVIIIKALFGYIVFRYYFLQLIFEYYIISGNIIVVFRHNKQEINLNLKMRNILLYVFGFTFYLSLLWCNPL